MITANHAVILGAVIGVLVFLVMHLAKWLSSRAFRYVRFTRANEDLMHLFVEYAKALNNVMLFEAAIARLIDETPKGALALFAVKLREIASTIPPLVLAQIRRFRLVEPPPADAPPVPEPGPPEEHVVVADEDAWGGEA